MHSKSRAAPRYVYLPRHRLAVLFCHKAGSSSAKRLLFEVTGESYRDPEDISLEPLQALADDGVALVQFVRNPVDRVVASWRRATRAARRFAMTGCLMAVSAPVWQWISKDDLSFSSYLRAVVDDFPDEKHVAPQYGMHGTIPRMTWPLEDAARGWRHVQQWHDLPAYPHRNASEIVNAGDHFSPADWGLFRRHYSEDLNWYADVCRNAEFRPA